jgi:hypothetical protein
MVNESHQSSLGKQIRRRNRGFSATRIWRRHLGNRLRIEAPILAPWDHGRIVHDGMRPGQEEGSHPTAAVATSMKPGCDGGMTR